MNIPLLVDSRRRTAHELVRDTLRRAILSGALAGGTRLVQADIATRLDVSTTPVREALRDLATEGLIRLDAHRGAIVHKPDTAEIRDLYDVRKLLEAEAIKRATKVISDADLDRAAALSNEMRVEQDSVAWADLNRRFHAILVDAAGSPRLSATLASLRDAAAVYVALLLELAPEHLHIANDAHQQLLDAMRRRDAPAAARIAVAHLESTIHAVEQARHPTAQAS